MHDSRSAPSSLLSESEAVLLLGVSRRTFQKWKAAGRIPFVAWSARLHRYRRSDLERLIRESTRSRRG